MSLIKFIFSKTFLYQLILAAVILFLLALAALEWLEATTNHNETVTVPDLSKMKIEKVDKKLDKINLNYKINDTAKYNPEYPNFSVIKQTPEPGELVKPDRKIFLVLNPKNYAEVKIPDYFRDTKRQVIPTLKSLGFKIGEIRYKPDIAKNAVLELWSGGKKLEPGDKLKKKSVIDLVLGK